MAHVLHLTEWEAPSDKLYCADIEELGKGIYKWWHLARLYNLPPADFLIELYNRGVKFDQYVPEKDLLVFSWDKKDKKKCHEFVLEVNRRAKSKNFIIG